MAEDAVPPPPPPGRACQRDGIVDFQALKAQIMMEIEAKLEKKDEELWRRGQAQMRKLQLEQQQMLARINDLQEREASLVKETLILRGALLEVTTKFESVVKDMREVLRGLPRNTAVMGVSPPSMASTSASPDARACHFAEISHSQTPRRKKSSELLLAGSVDTASHQPPAAAGGSWVASTGAEESSIVEMPSFDKASSAECRTPDFCTPPRNSGALEETALPSDSFISQPVSTQSPAVLSLAAALPSSPLACRPMHSPSLQEPSCNLSPSSVQMALSRSLPSPPRPGDDRRRGSTELTIELSKELGFTTLGMEVNQLEDETLLVKGIDAHGLVGRHNIKQDSDVNRILVGDRIVQVNDIANDSDGMLDECKAQQHLTVIISRDGIADSDDSTEESTSETSKAATPSVMRLRAEAYPFVPSAHKEQNQAALNAPPGLERHDDQPALEGAVVGAGGHQLMAASPLVPLGYEASAVDLMAAGIGTAGAAAAAAAAVGGIFPPYLPAPVGVTSSGSSGGLALEPPMLPNPYVATSGKANQEDVKRALFP